MTARLTNPKLLIPIMLVITLGIVPFIVTQDYVLHVLILILIYAYVVECWGIIGSYTGQLSLATGVFFGVGAYTSTFLFLNYNVSPWLGLLAGGALSAVVAFAIGYPCFRLNLKHLFFVMATLTINEVVRVWVKQTSFLGSAEGLWITTLGNSPLYFQFTSKVGYYYTALALLVVGVMFIYLGVERTHLKLYLTSIRENEDAAESIGINVLKYKLIAFTISAFLIAFAGTFFAQYYLYIHPDTTIQEAFAEQILLFGIIGGGGVIGPLAASFLLVPVSEVTRYILPSSFMGLHLIAYGVILYFVVMYKPDGIGGYFEKAVLGIVNRIKKGD